MSKTGKMDDGVQQLRLEEALTPDDSFQVSQERERVLSVITRVDQIAGAAEASRLIPDILDLMIEITLADSANFFQLDEAADELVITHVRGDTESQYLVGLRLNRRQGLPGISLCDTQVTVIGDLPTEPDWLRTVDPLNAARKKNVINLPIAIQERTLGLVQIFNYQQAELDLLTVLGGRLAVELERRVETGALQRSNQRLLDLVEMLGEVAGTLDRNQLSTHGDRTRSAPGERRTQLALFGRPNDERDGLPGRLPAARTRQGAHSRSAVWQAIPLLRAQ